MTFTENQLGKVDTGLEELLAQWKQDILDGNVNKDQVLGSINAMMKDVYDHIKIWEFDIYSDPIKAIVKFKVVTNVGYFKAENPKLPMQKLSTRPTLINNYIRGSVLAQLEDKDLSATEEDINEIVRSVVFAIEGPIQEAIGETISNVLDIPDEMWVCNTDKK
jgi:hypothetical protein